MADAAEAYTKHIDSGGKMLISLAGAMSTAELGITLAEMIRRNKVHAISCTGANLEEDVMNLIAHEDYLQLKNYRTLKPEEEKKILDDDFNRVTDVAIPEIKAFEPILKMLEKLWDQATAGASTLPGVPQGTPKAYFPHEYLYRILLSGELKNKYQIDPKDSWMLAAAEKNLPIACPGWGDSSMGNAFAALCLKKKYKSNIIKYDIDAMQFLAEWYLKNSGGQGIGFFQIGGGIAGDFPICVVPMLTYDVKIKNVPIWKYFAQISDSTTSYGSYSGAEPTEKITWGKVAEDTPMFVIESDATIVAPLIFSYVLDL